MNLTITTDVSSLIVMMIVAITFLMIFYFNNYNNKVATLIQGTYTILIIYIDLQLTYLHQQEKLNLSFFFFTCFTKENWLVSHNACLALTRFVCTTQSVQFKWFQACCINGIKFAPMK